MEGGICRGDGRGYGRGVCRHNGGNGGGTKGNGWVRVTVVVMGE